MKQLNETLDYHDFVGEVQNLVTVDEYSAKMGKDKDIVTVTFIVNSKLCGEDLTKWIENGYDFVLDAAVSDGSLDNNDWLVFVEMDRRTAVPERIIEILEDLEPLTNIKLDDWVVLVKDKKYKADPAVLKDVIILSPKEYKRIKRLENKEDELNDMRDIAGLEHPGDEEAEESDVEIDTELKEFINRAGL
jgi:hypothetical protein